MLVDNYNDCYRGVLKTQSSFGRTKVVNIMEASSRSAVVEEREFLHCHYYQYNCWSSVADNAGVDEQQQQQQHCIDVHILPYPTAHPTAHAYLNDLDILRLVARQLQYCLICCNSHVTHVTAAALIVAPHPRKRRRTA